MARGRERQVGIRDWLQAARELDDPRMDVSAFVNWMVLVFVVDGAFTNVRLINWLCKHSRPHSLVFHVTCLQHTVHNAIVPAAEHLKLTTLCLLHISPTPRDS